MFSVFPQSSIYRWVTFKPFFLNPLSISHIRRWIFFQMPFPSEMLWMYLRDLMFLFITGRKIFWSVRVFRFTTQPCGVQANECDRQWQHCADPSPRNHGGFHSSLLGSLKGMRYTNTVSGFAASDATALTALFIIKLDFVLLWVCSTPFAPSLQHSLIYFHPRGSEVVPSVNPSILCLSSCPCPILLPIFYLLPVFSLLIYPFSFPVPSAPNPLI